MFSRKAVSEFVLHFKPSVQILNLVTNTLVSYTAALKNQYKSIWITSEIVSIEQVDKLSGLVQYIFFRSITQGLAYQTVRCRRGWGRRRAQRVSKRSTVLPDSPWWRGCRRWLGNAGRYSDRCPRAAQQKNTIWGRKLRVGQKGILCITVRLSQPIVKFVGKARSLPWYGALEKLFTQVGSGLTRKN